VLDDRPRSEQTPVNELRNLLGGVTSTEVDVLRRRLEALEAKLAATEAELSRLADPQGQTAVVASVLPEAFEARRTRDGAPVAVRPEVERAIFRSSRETPDVMAEALFPVLGPAVRKMIADLFTFDAMKGGSTFEISNVYLLHGETGLPLAVAAGDETTDGDADMVSGMLDALRSFVQDAFGAEESDGLRELRVGDVTVLVEWGPQAVLAVVTRGMITETVRPDMQRLLESIHRTHVEALEQFNGDSGAFTDLEQSLLELRATAPPPAKPSIVKRVLPFLVLAVLIALIAVIVWLIVRA